MDVIISYPVKALVLKVSLKPHKKLSLLLEEAETSVYCFLPAATAQGAVTEAKSIISLKKCMQYLQLWDLIQLFFFFKQRDTKKENGCVSSCSFAGCIAEVPHKH